MRLKVFLLVWILLIQAQAQLFDYGTRAGDQTLEISSGQHAVAIDVPMVYMENSYNEIYISPNGIIGFGERLPDGVEPLQRLNKSAIAVFYAPVSEGKIYFRTTSSDQRLIRRLTDYIHKTFADSSEFSTLQAMVVTWHEMQNKELDDKATFQLVLASDGMTTYAVIQFLALPWSVSGGIYAQSGFSLADGRHRSNINSGTPDVKDLVGLSNNPEGSFVFRISGATIEDPRENVDDYDYTNYDQTDYDGDDRKPPADCPVDPYGDRCPEGCNILTDERHCSRCVCAEPNPEDGAEDNQLSDYTVHEKLPQRPHAPSVDRRTQDSTSEPQREAEGTDKKPNELEREHEREPAPQHAQEGEQRTNVVNCASAGQEACNPNALCRMLSSKNFRDFASGFCCECQPGFYGNGKECLKSGDPQRISGSFEGVINGIPIDRTDLHTFITPTDGHAYTAISKIPSDLGYPLLLLNPIGSIMGWLFAEVKSPSVYNGFQLAGGLFNRTVTLHIGDRNHLTIRQQFSGRDIYHYFKSTVFVSGTLPDIAPDTEIVFPNYEEEYRRERPGLVRSYTGVDILLKEAGQQRTIRMTIDQQIQFKECPHQNFDKDSAVALRVEGVHVTYDSHEGIVRYASRNYASEVGRERNPSESDMGSSISSRQQAGTQHQAQNPTTNRGEVSYFPRYLRRRSPCVHVAEYAVSSR
uniref:Nidogen-1 n=1 Tax=Angiostrongylus cantonensis TaxID=6313 RepID=A0A158P9V5_ANGCA